MYRRALSEYGRFRESGFRQYQEGAIDYAHKSNKLVTVIIAPTGCHAMGQLILMADGSLKPVEEIVVGDYVMGQDSEHRKVLELHRGYDDMYRIIPAKGEPFIVNKNHILTLKRTRCGVNKKRKDSLAGTFIDVSVSEWLNWSKTHKHIHKLARQSVSFYKMADLLPIEPYFLGVLLGDGSLKHQNICITTKDQEIKDEIYRQANKFCLIVRVVGGLQYYLSEGRESQEKRKINGLYTPYKHILKSDLNDLGLMGKGSGDKFIPFIYKTTSRWQRLELIAGLLDTDGSLSGGTYDYISKSEQLADDMVYLCRSVGLAAYKKQTIKSCQNNFSGIYYRVSISGNTDIIPCRLPRKQAIQRAQKKDVLVTGFSVEPIGKDYYYGFTLDGNGRYLLGDFTLTHNSGKSIIGMVLGGLKDKFLYLVSSKHLQDQLHEDFPEAEMMMGRSNYPCHASNGTADDCFHSTETPCPEKYTSCAYEKQKQRTLNSRRQILNYAYFLTEANYIGRFSDYPLIVADEADGLEDMLSDMVSLDFSAHMLKRWGLPYPKYKSVSSENTLAHWRHWARECVDITGENIERLTDGMHEISDFDSGQIKIVKDIQKLRNLTTKLRSVLAYMDDTWVVNIYNRTGLSTLWSLRPTWLNPDMTNRFFFRHGNKFVMMSATFPYKDVFAEMLGIPLGDMDMIEVPSTFPIDNRKVYLKYTADLRSQKGEGIDADEIEKAQKEVTRLLNLHKGEKGIIHTVNWKLNDAIMQIGDPRLITHTTDNKRDMINRFITSTDEVFVSPSSTRGVDLYDDRSRFNIIVKCPYKSLGDKLVASRVYGKRTIGNYWYRSICAQEIVQACGRSVRHKDDWCKTYVLDRQACDLIVNNQKLFPRYFIEAVEV